LSNKERKKKSFGIKHPNQKIFAPKNVIIVYFDQIVGNQVIWLPFFLLWIFKLERKSYFTFYKKVSKFLKQSS